MASPLSVIPPAGFVQRVKALGGADWDVRWNTEVQRWEFVSLSSANTPVSQFYGWSHCEADPVTGLLPFRDIHDADAQTEILAAMERTYIGNRHDGDGTWKRQIANRRQFNKAVDAATIKRRAETYADLIHEVNLSRPWKKYHERNTGPATIIAPR